MRILLETVARDSDHSGLFPAAGGGKIAAFEKSLFIAYGAEVSTEGRRRQAHLVSPGAVARGKVVSWVCGTLPAEGDAVLLEGSFEL